MIRVDPIAGDQETGGACLALDMPSRLEQNI